MIDDERDEGSVECMDLEATPESILLTLLIMEIGISEGSSAIFCAVSSSRIECMVERRLERKSSTGFGARGSKRGTW